MRGETGRNYCEKRNRKELRDGLTSQIIGSFHEQLFNAHLQQVKLHSAINTDQFVDPLPIGLGLKGGVPHGGLIGGYPAQIGEGL